MKQMRRGVFETNSSSSHSISVKRGYGLEPNYLQIEDDGYIHVEFGEFYWGVESFDDQETRLVYLLTMALVLTRDTWLGSDEEETERFIHTKEFERINKVVSEYTGCNGIWIEPSRGDIDHQSYEDYKDLDEFLDTYWIDIEEFIFGAGVTLHIDNDNH